MVVLAAAVVKTGAGGGRILVSRQYVRMTRVRVEGLLVGAWSVHTRVSRARPPPRPSRLTRRRFAAATRRRAAFGKLLGPHLQLQSQHTYIETESMRYVYQPLDDALYVVLMTNLGSNIVDDIFTMGMMSQAVTDVCRGWVCEEQLTGHAFEIVNIMDELVRPSGYRSVSSMSSVHQAIRMESQEEKLHKMIVANKIEETKRTMKEKARELDREKMEKLRRERAMESGGRYPYGGRSPTSFSGSMGGGGGFSGSMGGGFGGGQAGDGGMMPSIQPARRTSSSSGRPKVTPGSSLKKGMQLSTKGRRENALLESLALEGDIQDVPATSSGAPAPQPASQPGLTRKPIEVAISEAVSVHLHQDGSFDSMAVQGQLSITVHEESAAASRVAIVNGSRAAADGVKFNFITHPKIDKALFGRVDAAGRNVLSLKDRGAAFPMNTDLGLLKWRANVKDSAPDSVPLLVNCWPSEAATETYVNVEYEAPEGFELRHVKIVIPMPSGGGDRRPPSVNSVDTGDTSFDARGSALVWEIPLVDESNQTGSMEAVVGFKAPSASFFPINVSFEAPQTICDVSVDRIAYVDPDDDDGSADGPAVPFGVQRSMSVEKYTVG